MANASIKNGLAIVVDGKMSAKCCRQCMVTTPDDDCGCKSANPVGFWVSIAGVESCGCIVRDSFYPYSFSGCEDVNGMYYIRAEAINADIKDADSPLTLGILLPSVSFSCVYCEGFDGFGLRAYRYVGLDRNCDGTPDEPVPAWDWIHVAARPFALPAGDANWHMGVAVGWSSGPPWAGEAGHAVGGRFLYAEIGKGNSAINSCSDFNFGGAGYGAEGTQTWDCTTLPDSPFNDVKYQYCTGGSIRLYAVSPCDDAESWDGATSYLEHAVVIRSSDCYVAKIDNVNKDPLTSTDEWALFG